MKFLKITFLFVIVSSCLLLSQKEKYNYVHPFSGKVVFSTEFGFTHSYTDFVFSRPELLSRGTIEFYLPVKSSNALGIKVTSGLGNLNSFGRNDFEKFNNPNFNTNLFFIGTGINYTGKLGYSIPYLSATISHLRINPKDSRGKLLPNNLKRKYDLNLTMYTTEIGIRFLVRDFWSINIGMNYNFTNSDYVDDLKINEQNDKFISLFFGLSFYYGGASYKDTDNDGIADNKDVCPNTPTGVKVDEFGCTTDEKPNKNIIAKLPKVEKIKEQTPVKKKTKFKKVKLSYQYSTEKVLPELFFTDGNLFCFQVGVFRNVEAAEMLKNKLKKSGHHSFIAKPNQTKNNDKLFRVRVGYFKSLQSAKRYKLKYKDLF